MEFYWDDYMTHWNNYVEGLKRETRLRIMNRNRKSNKIKKERMKEDSKRRKQSESDEELIEPED
jgi:hypothetical protein